MSASSGDEEGRTRRKDQSIMKKKKRKREEDDKRRKEGKKMRRGNDTRFPTRAHQRAPASNGDEEGRIDQREEKDRSTDTKRRRGCEERGTTTRVKSCIRASEGRKREEDDRTQHENSFPRSPELQLPSCSMLQHP